MRFNRARILAAGATVALSATGALVAGAGPVKAATPSCGSTCVNVFSREFGTHTHPNFVLDVYRGAQRVGQPLILFRTSNSDAAEDFTVGYQGQVSDFYATGLVSSAVALHYGCGFNLNTGQCGNTSADDYAFEVEYSPLGQETGLCAGVAFTATQGEHVTLQPCGVSARTVWIIDTADSTGVNSDYSPAINGSDVNFSHPFVLSYPSNGYPTDTPRPVLQVRNLTGFSGGFGPAPGTVNGFQEWGVKPGVLN